MTTTTTTQPTKVIKTKEYLAATAAIYDAASGYELSRIDTAQLKKGALLTVEEMKAIIANPPR